MKKKSNKDTKEFGWKIFQRRELSSSGLGIKEKGSKVLR